MKDIIDGKWRAFRSGAIHPILFRVTRVCVSELDHHIESDNGLLPVWHQTIFCAGSLLIDKFVNKLNEMWIKVRLSLIQEN